ncbi:hypothetical protein MKEN_00909400 [Mycena kentingensis (nom. inval.)]|nr:hypothetical protein MKEN_00909400 [Mycena kentingensis (nom. inval.)]
MYRTLALASCFLALIVVPGLLANPVPSYQNSVILNLFLKFFVCFMGAFHPSLKRVRIPVLVALLTFSASILQDRFTLFHAIVACDVVAWCFWLELAKIWLQILYQMVSDESTHSGGMPAHDEVRVVLIPSP